jgi:hypothetical protein
MHSLEKLLNTTAASHHPSRLRRGRGVVTEHEVRGVGYINVSQGEEECLLGGG